MDFKQPNSSNLNFMIKQKSVSDIARSQTAGNLFQSQKFNMPIEVSEYQKFKGMRDEYLGYDAPVEPTVSGNEIDTQEANENYFDQIFEKVQVTLSKPMTQKTLAAAFAVVSLHFFGESQAQSDSLAAFNSASYLLQNQDHSINLQNLQMLTYLALSPLYVKLFR